SKFYIHKDYIKKYPKTHLYGLLNFNEMKEDVNESDYEIDVEFEPYIFNHIYSYYTTGEYPKKYSRKILE
ncbi:162_t:CDS:2, partial [Gigaspora margarita]